MDISVVLQQMIVLFLLMVVGFIANKFKVINTESNSHLTKLVLNVSLPALTITSVADGAGRFEKSYLLYIFLISIITYIIMGVLAVIISRLIGGRREDRGTYAAMAFLGNVGFMGFPVISAIFGSDTIFYGAIINVVFNVIVFSVGIKMISGGGTDAKFSPKMLINGPLVSSAIAIVMFLFEIQLPPVINNAFNYLGDVTTPVAMIILGSTLADMEVREIFSEWRIYVITAVKLIVMPLAVYAVLSRFMIGEELFLGVVVALAATPMASSITMLSIQYGGNKKLVGSGIFISTLLSVVTIPLLVSLLFT